MDGFVDTLRGEKIKVGKCTITSLLFLLLLLLKKNDHRCGIRCDYELLIRITNPTSMRDARCAEIRPGLAFVWEAKLVLLARGLMIRMVEGSLTIFNIFFELYMLL